MTRDSEYQPHHVHEANSYTYCLPARHSLVRRRVYYIASARTLDGLALGSLTSSTAYRQCLRAIKRACLCGRQFVDLLPLMALSPQLGRHVVDKHARARDGHHDACPSMIL